MSQQMKKIHFLFSDPSAAPPPPVLCKTNLLRTSLHPVPLQCEVRVRLFLQYDLMHLWCVQVLPFKDRLSQQTGSWKHQVLSENRLTHPVSLSPSVSVSLPAAIQDVPGISPLQSLQLIGWQLRAAIGQRAEDFIWQEHGQRYSRHTHIQSTAVCGTAAETDRQTDRQTDRCLHMKFTNQSHVLSVWTPFIEMTSYRLLALTSNWNRLKLLCVCVCTWAGECVCAPAGRG